MAFTLKKVLAFFMMPVSIGLILCLIALYFLYANKIKKAKVFLFFSFSWFFLISFAPVSNALVKPLETLHPKMNSTVENAHYVLLLGGDFQNRAYEALRIYKASENLKIITSGFEGADQISEAQDAKERLVQIGVPSEDIIMQTTPKDTFEEAQEVKKLVGTEPLIVVTSAIHMPRAMLIFKNAGLNVIPAPTDFLYKEEVSFYGLIGASYMLNTQKAMHEYIGLVYGLLHDMYVTLKGMM